MRISMGIACERCGTLFLITSAGNPHIRPAPRPRETGMYFLDCICGGKQLFHKNYLKPFTVSEHSHMLGFAKRGHYAKPGGMRTCGVG
jgi:hypothetical protein